MSRSVLVTGASGFIGRRLIAQLLDADYDVRAVARDPRGLDARKGLRVVPWDLLDARGPDDGLHGVTLAVHLAACIPGPTVEAGGEAEDFNGNLVITANLLAHLKDLRHAVFTSTIDVYGRPSSLPIREDSPTEPLTAYGRSKLLCERALAEAGAVRGLTLAVLRLTQVYGPGERPIKAIPRFVEALRAGRRPVIYGDGSELRDYLYVEDAARAIVLALEQRAAGVFNISTGQPHPIADVMALLAQAIPAEVRPMYADRVGEKLDLWMDTTRAQDVLGYRPRVSLREGLRRHYEWAARQAS